MMRFILNVVHAYLQLNRWIVLFSEAKGYGPAVCLSTPTKIVHTHLHFIPVTHVLGSQSYQDPKLDL